MVGYHGALSTWFDWSLWLHAARARPDWSFVLVGPAFRVTEEEIRERVAERPNLYYLGAKPFRQLTRYTARFDVAAIPFTLNAVTHACSPVKLFEYMAAGKPVVATPMREVLKYRSVLVADGPDSFVARLDEAVARRSDPDYQALLAREAAANTWRSRAETLRHALEDVLARQGRVPRRHLLRAKAGGVGVPPASGEAVMRGGR